MEGHLDCPPALPLNMGARIGDRAPPRHRTPPQELSELLARLQDRRAEIGQAILSRVYAVSDPGSVDDPLYVTGLRAAVDAAIEFGFSALQTSGERPHPVPSELLVQARNAAHRGVPLETVLRRYVAGHSLLGDFILREGEAIALSSVSLHRALKAEATMLDYLIGAVAAEYRSEVDARARSSHRRAAERVEKLLGGEATDLHELNYRLDAWHVGAIAVGLEGEGTLRDLATTLRRRVLIVRHRESTVWAWLGGTREFDAEEVEQLMDTSWPAAVIVAFGEPAHGPSGWRLSHRQAVAALPVALHGPKPRVRYADVAVLASLLQDEILAVSLRRLYLEPLDEEREGGAVLRQTLRAYFEAERNVSSTAAALGVSRKTVTSRLHTVEARIGRCLAACDADLELTLRLEELTGAPSDY